MGTRQDAKLSPVINASTGLLHSLCSWSCLLIQPAADHYVAKLTGMMPEDPWKAALADQAYFFCEDIWQTMYVGWQICVRVGREDMLFRTPNAPQHLWHSL